MDLSTLVEGPPLVLCSGSLDYRITVFGSHCNRSTSLRHLLIYSALLLLESENLPTFAASFSPQCVPLWIRQHDVRRSEHSSRLASHGSHGSGRVAYCKRVNYNKESRHTTNNFVSYRRSHVTIRFGLSTRFGMVTDLDLCDLPRPSRSLPAAMVSLSPSRQGPEEPFSILLTCGSVTEKFGVVLVLYWCDRRSRIERALFNSRLYHSFTLP